MLTAHKIQLLPNNKQANYFSQACGTARVAWNWALAEWEQQYKDGKKPNVNELDKIFNATKRELYPWMYDENGKLAVNACVTQYVIKYDLKRAWKNFFEKRADRPKFKAKGKSRDSFYLDNTKVKIDLAEKRIWIQKVGFVRCCERLRFDGKVMAARVSRIADKWYIAIQVDIAEPTQKPKKHDVIGVDFGISALATLSDGSKVENPAPLKKALQQLRRLQRHLPKRPGDGQDKGVKVRVTKDSRKHKLLKQRIARLHARVADIRSDAQHQLSAYLSRKYQTVVIEDLNVKGMLKNGKLARSIMDVGFHGLRSKLEYKCQRSGTNLILANRWLPSSKTCSACGSYKENLSLSDRIFRCDDCGMVLDRDHNAAINLAVLAEVNPSLLREDAASGSKRKPRVKAAPVNAEPGNH